MSIYPAQFSIIRHSLCKMWFCGTNRDVKIAFYVGILITLLHINLLLFFHARYYFSDDFVRRFRWYHYQAPCKTTPGASQDMRELTSSTMKALQELSVSAAICYGTLWGMLRTGSILPWDRSIDFCVMSQELRNVTFFDLQRVLKQEGVHLSSFDWEDGSYGLTKGNAVGEINVFYDCTELVYFTRPEHRYSRDYPPYIPNPPPEVPRWACPMGLSPMVASLAHDLSKPFPKWLLEPPFSSLNVEGVNVSLPQDGIEIQKYLYPDDWWLEVRPPGC